MSTLNQTTKTEVPTGRATRLVSEALLAAEHTHLFTRLAGLDGQLLGWCEPTPGQPVLVYSRPGVLEELQRQVSRRSEYSDPELATVAACMALEALETGVVPGQGPLFLNHPAASI